MVSIKEREGIRMKFINVVTISGILLLGILLITGVRTIVWRIGIILDDKILGILLIAIGILSIIQTRQKEVTK